MDISALQEQQQLLHNLTCSVYYRHGANVPCMGQKVSVSRSKFLSDKEDDVVNVMNTNNINAQV